MSLEIEYSLLSQDWPKPQWTKNKAGFYEVPIWLVKWAKTPCDLMFKGRVEHITTLAYLLLYFRPTLCCQKADFEDLNPIRDQELDREFRMEWGGKFPVLSDALFIFNTIGNTNDWMRTQLRRTVKTRRSSRKLTVVHYLDSFSQWESLGIEFPLIVEVI